MRIAVISEFAGDHFDGVVSSVCAELAGRYPASRVVFVSGVLQRYRYGGLRPSRLVNYAVVYARSLACYIRHRPDIVLVDTTPPLIQWWAALLGRMFKSRVYIWLMDYHPEIEAHCCDSIRGFRWLAKALRRLDTALLKRVSGVITLDEAMADIVRTRSPDIDVRVHPVWSKQGTGLFEPVVLNRDPSEFRLAYVGNLGAAHGLGDLENILAGVASERSLKLMIVGGNAAGLGRWKKMAQRLGAVVRHTERLSWNVLRERLNDFCPNYGVVLMDEDKQGLLSPSKYATYMQLGLPILYIGPRRTNADAVCRTTGAGLAATRDDIVRNAQTVVRDLLDPAAQGERQAATRAAHATLGRLNAISFVELIDPWIQGTAGAGRP